MVSNNLSKDEMYVKSDLYHSILQVSFNRNKGKIKWHLTLIL
jgi:hypothetical protein